MDNEMPRKRQTQHIIVSDRAGLPYSKGLMASSIMATGLAPFRAYEVAERVEEELVGAERFEVTREELKDLATKAISEMVGQRYAETYRNWQSVEELDLSLIVLIGGTTGVGKSTVATQLAARLGITRIISTDAVREVMRALFSERIMPALHTSSFEAHEALRGPLPRSADPVVVGFEEQVRAVSVAIEALIERSVLEGTDLIIEGAHLVPGFIESPPWAPPWDDKAVVVPIVITIDDEDVHRSHFFLRAVDAGQRNVERYLRSFENIRKVQKYIRSAAQQRGAPVVSSYSLDATLAAVIDHIVEKVAERMKVAVREDVSVPKRTGASDRPAHVVGRRTR
jgi:2-phosphoglycerate kinase